MRLGPALLALTILAGTAAADVFPVQWGQLVQPLPVPRTDFGVAQMDRYFVFVGGNAPGDEAVGTRIDVYDAFTSSWVSKHLLPNFPVALFDPAVTAIGPDILVIGGAVHGTGGVQTPLPVTWLLDTRLPIALRTWVPFPMPEALSHSMVVSDTFQHVWLFGGFGADGAASTHAYRMDALPDGTPTGAWLPLADMPIPRARGGAVQFSNQQLFVVGGESGVLQPTPEVDVFDVAAGTWSRGPDLPTPREDLAVVRGADGIYAFGGRTPTFASAAVEFYDQDVGQWVQLPDMPAPQWGGASLGFLDDLYLFGGHDSVGDPTRMAQKAHVDEGLG